MICSLKRVISESRPTMSWARVDSIGLSSKGFPLRGGRSSRETASPIIARAASSLILNIHASSRFSYGDLTHSRVFPRGFSWALFTQCYECDNSMLTLH